MGGYEVRPPPERLGERAQLRTAFSTHRGTVTAFMVQLEYLLQDDWHPVVRYDHHQDAPGGHDITEEGLHRDIYREGEQIRSESVSLPIQANKGFDAAEEDLREHAERYVRRFEIWHGVTD